ncbi:endo alpha-1,4 polygalactosaminidase [Streptacidiphilus sp. N1-12]|uniref:Endo alpha-1,4 polygalactosaminidase n=2 Tax=Streptacidiphilus alkalitolerans TaxID=3342712 RepID=A0ABV6WNU1_9ACTN
MRRPGRRLLGLCGGALLLVLAGCGPGGGATGAPSPRPPSGPASSGAASPGGGAASGVPTAASRGPRWQPVPGESWQWQLSRTVDTGVDAAVYDIDGFDNSAAVVAALHAEGRRVICYINVGAYEDFRPDRSSYPAALLGAGDGWPGERWLDVRRTALLRPIIARRFDMCRDKGFDAVEPDNVDGYANRSGFPLTAADQLAFNRMVAGLAHARGLAVGLKNDLDQVPALVGDFDFAVNEQCAEFQECGELAPFTNRGKAVFEAEYGLPVADFCPEARRMRFSAVLKHPVLDAWRRGC